MRIDERIAAGTEPSFSFEFFPPRTDEGERNLGRALAELSRLSPTFVSVTYGAGGQHDREAQDDRHRQAPQARLRHGGDGALHVRRRDDRRAARDARHDARRRHRERARAARRPARGQTEWTATEGGLRYSRELIELIREEYDFAIGAACFPEVHIHATDAESDLRYLKEKVDAGARFLITQLFFDNQAYYDFVARAREPGIDVPIIPGIMPITERRADQADHGDVRREIPAGLLRELELRGDQPGAVTDLGVAYATLQCADLLANGAPGHPLLHAQPLARRRARSSARCG